MPDENSTATAKELIEALQKLPPETQLYTEGGWVGVYCPTMDDVSYFADGTPRVELIGPVARRAT